MAEIHVKGMREIGEFLQKFPLKLEANIMRGALGTGAKVIRDRAKALAPVANPSRGGAKRFGHYRGALRDSIRVSTRIETKKGRVVAAVRAGGKRKGKADVFYAKWVEFGTKPHLISVREDEKRINIRKSLRVGTVIRESMRTINRRVLQIGNYFVGPTVQHGGSVARPFLRPAMDAGASGAVVAAAEYMRNRLKTKHGLDTPEVFIEEE